MLVPPDAANTTAWGKPFAASFEILIVEHLYRFKSPHLALRFYYKKYHKKYW